MICESCRNYYCTCANDPQLCVTSNQSVLTIAQPPLYRCSQGHEQRGKTVFVGFQAAGESKPFCFWCYADWVTKAFPTSEVKA